MKASSDDIRGNHAQPPAHAGRLAQVSASAAVGESAELDFSNVSMGPLGTLSCKPERAERTNVVLVIHGPKQISEAEFSSQTRNGAVILPVKGTEKT